MNEIISCNDAIAQEYLIQSLLNVFPDDFLLAGFPNLLMCLCHLHPTVNISMLLLMMMVVVNDIVEDLFSEMLSRIQGYEEKQVSEEVMKTVSEAILELVRTLKEVCFNLTNKMDVHLLSDDESQ